MIGAKISSRSEATSIWTSGLDIYLAGSQDSVCHYVFSKEERKFKFIASDTKPKETLDCISVTDAIDESLTIFATFKSGEFVGYTQNQKKTLTPSLSINLNEICHRIQFVGLRKLKAEYMTTHFDNMRLMDFVIPWESDKIKTPIVLTSSLNTRFYVWRISTQLFDLLHKICTLMLDFNSTRPLLLGSWEGFRKTDQGSMTNVIDGLFLSQYLHLPYEKKEVVVKKLPIIEKPLVLELCSPGERLIFHRSLQVSDVETIIKYFEQSI